MKIMTLMALLLLAACGNNPVPPGPGPGPGPLPPNGFYIGAKCSEVIGTAKAPVTMDQAQFAAKMALKGLGE